MNQTHTVLSALSHKLKFTPIVVFSSAMQMAGIEVKAADVDLELHLSDFKALVPETVDVLDMRKSPCGNLLGYYKKIEVEGIPVELTSQTKLLKVGADGWTSPRDINYRRDTDYKRIGNLIVPYYKPLAQLKLYLAMNRDKDKEKIALLQKHIYG